MIQMIFGFESGANSNSDISPLYFMSVVGSDECADCIMELLNFLAIQKYIFINPLSMLRISNCK